MPALSALARWGRLIDATASLSSPSGRTWSTPRATDGERGGRGDLLAQVRTGRTSRRKEWKGEEIVSPTPSASSYGSNQGGSAGRMGPVRHSLASMAKTGMWPTPQAVDGTRGTVGNALARKAAKGRTNGISLPDAVRLWPTPAARDGKDRGNFTIRTREGGQGLSLPMTVGGQLNPEWVEALMGFPPGWTDGRTESLAPSPNGAPTMEPACGDLATPLFHRSLNSPADCCSPESGDMREKWTQVEGSHLLTGPCSGCGADAYAAPGQERTARCSACWDRIRGGAPVVAQQQQFGTVEPAEELPAGIYRDSSGILRDKRWNGYMLPDPATGVLRRYRRVTTLVNVLKSKDNITDWKMRLVAWGMSARPDLQQRASGAVVDADGKFTDPWKKALDEIAQEAFRAAGGERGSDRGTDWHRWREMYDEGPMGRWATATNIPEDVQRSMRARAHVMESAGLSVVPGMSERVLIIPELDVAGTVDEIFRSTDGVFYVGDEKSQQAWYEGGLAEAVQMACYSRAKWIVDIENLRGIALTDPAAALKCLSPMPPVLDQQVAKIVWVPAGKNYAEVKDVDLVMGWKWAVRAAELIADRKGDWVTTAQVQPAAPAVAPLVQDRLAGTRAGAAYGIDRAPERLIDVPEDFGGISEAGAPTSASCQAAECVARGGCPPPEPLKTIYGQMERATGLADLSWIRGHHIAGGRWAAGFDSLGVKLARDRGWLP